MGPVRPNHPTARAREERADEDRSPEPRAPHHLAQGLTDPDDADRALRGWKNAHLQSLLGGKASTRWRQS